MSLHRAVGQMMSTMFYPLVTFVLLVICIAYWAMTALYPLSTVQLWGAVLRGKEVLAHTMSESIWQIYPFLWAAVALWLNTTE